MKNTKTGHITVLREESVRPLLANDGTVYVDGTVGGGGHLELLLAGKPNGTVFAFDKDAHAIERIKHRFPDEIASGRLKLVHGSYCELQQRMTENGISAVDGVLLDLGFSSYQVEDAKRGLSFLLDGPLDMRLDQTQELTAADIVNEWPEPDIVRIFREFGEEKKAPRLARAIVGRREASLFTSTEDFAKVIVEATSPRDRRVNKIHPATRCFQALRIAVNGELEALGRFLTQIPEILQIDGAVSIISFHSLEDRLVKRRFKLLSDSCICEDPFPACDRCYNPEGMLPQRRPIRPDEGETENNPRSRSARLRVFVRKSQKKGSPP